MFILTFDWFGRISLKPSDFVLGTGFIGPWIRLIFLVFDFLFELVYFRWRTIHDCCAAQ